MYIEDDIQLPILTPNTLIFGQQNCIPSIEDKHDIEEKDLRKRFKYIQSCKNSTWSRWSQDYMKALRERHNMNHKSKTAIVKTGDVVLIKGDSKNRGKWNIGIVTNLFQGTD